jgi:hypothetical protein
MGGCACSRRSDWATVMHKTLSATESQSPVSGSRGPWLRGLEEAGNNQLNLHGFKLEAGQYGYSMEWWPNDDASCVPVFDGGPQRGLSLAASTVLITRGVSNHQWWPSSLPRLLLFGGVWCVKPSVTASTSLESTVGLYVFAFLPRGPRMPQHTLGRRGGRAPTVGQ